jgi:hypothetical protein
MPTVRKTRGRTFCDDGVSSVEVVYGSVVWRWPCRTYATSTIAGDGGFRLCPHQRQRPRRSRGPRPGRPTRSWLTKGGLAVPCSTRTREHGGGDDTEGETWHRPPGSWSPCPRHDQPHDPHATRAPTERLRTELRRDGVKRIVPFRCPMRRPGEARPAGRATGRPRRPVREHVVTPRHPIAARLARCRTTAPRPASPRGPGRPRGGGVGPRARIGAPAPVPPPRTARNRGRRG